MNVLSIKLPIRKKCGTLFNDARTLKQKFMICNRIANLGSVYQLKWMIYTKIGKVFFDSLLYDGEQNVGKHFLSDTYIRKNGLYTTE